MRICDLSSDKLYVGMRIKSLTKDRYGTLVANDYHDDNYWWIQWDGESKPYGGFYGTDCSCEVVND